jgi:hypothetical protein
MAFLGFQRGTKKDGCVMWEKSTIVVSPEINLGAIWSFFQELVLQCFANISRMLMDAIYLRLLFAKGI